MNQERKPRGHKHAILPALSKRFDSGLLALSSHLLGQQKQLSDTVVGDDKQRCVLDAQEHIYLHHGCRDR